MSLTKKLSQMRTFLIISILFFVSCEKEHQNKLSAAQLQAVAKMESDFQLAKVYNDSLAYAINGTLRNADSTMIHYFDNMYHQYDLEFQNCHSQYMHNLESADHSHNSQGMVEMHNSNGGMMGSCNCCANGGHKADIHQKMETLHELHKTYHH